MKRTALVLVTDGSEEMETVIIVDVLRRAKIEVTLASLQEDDADAVETPAAAVTCSRNVRLVPDTTLKHAISAAPSYDIVVLPGGGPGAKAFCESSQVKAVLERQEKSETGLIGAVCAAPTALQAHKIGLGKTITSFPAFKEQLSKDYTYSEDRVVRDGNLLTSRGPGTCFEFAEKIVQALVDEETAKSVSGAMLVKQ